MELGDTIWHKWLRRPYKLSASDSGEGERTIVLLHGVGSSRGIWAPLVWQLEAAGWRVIAPDLLGFGESPKPQWSSYTVQDHARQVTVLLKRLKVKRPVTIVGHSMGCLVGTHIAASHPGLVRHLLLYQPPLYADDPEFTSHLKRREHYFALYEFIATHPQLAFTHAQFLWRVAKRLVNFQLSPEMWVPFQRSLRNTIMQQTAYRQLHSIHIPTDIVHGRFDLIVTRRDLRAMYRKNRYITWRTVSDTHGLSARSARYLARLLGSRTVRA